MVHLQNYKGFSYTVLDGDNSIVFMNALSTGESATMKDSNNNDVNLSSFIDNGYDVNIVVDTTAPTITLAGNRNRRKRINLY